MTQFGSRKGIISFANYAADFAIIEPGKAVITRAISNSEDEQKSVNNARADSLYRKQIVVKTSAYLISEPNDRDGNQQHAHIYMGLNLLHCCLIFCLF